MDLLNLVDKLETMATTSGKVPGTRKLLIDQDKALELVDLMRLGIPKDIQEAEEVLDFLLDLNGHLYQKKLVLDHII